MNGIGYKNISSGLKSIGQNRNTYFPVYIINAI